jgi:hypothetical protein
LGSWVISATAGVVVVVVALDVSWFASESAALSLPELHASNTPNNAIGKIIFFTFIVLKFKITIALR